jgi:hypothetical protein
MVKISRGQAFRLGLTRYYTANLCSKGHDSERHTSNGKCVVCHRDKVKLRIKMLRKQSVETCISKSCVI